MELRDNRKRKISRDGERGIGGLKRMGFEIGLDGGIRYFDRRKCEN
jgi:hypothetical protein